MNKRNTIYGLKIIKLLELELDPELKVTNKVANAFNLKGVKAKTMDETTDLLSKNLVRIKRGIKYFINSNILSIR